MSRQRHAIFIHDLTVVRVKGRTKGQCSCGVTFPFMDAVELTLAHEAHAERSAAEGLREHFAARRLGFTRA